MFMLESEDFLLPDVPIYGLTWSIADHFGGMTSVLLHRSKVFSDLAGKAVDLLTLGPDLDVTATEERLRLEGRLGAKVRLRNAWHELRKMSEADLAAFCERSPGVTERVAQQLSPSSGDTIVTRYDDQGTVALQHDHFRPDGTRLACDELDTTTPGTKGGRRLTVYSRAGHPLGQWSAAVDLYTDWIEHATNDSLGALIIDSEFVANMLKQYRSPNLLTVCVLHNMHLRPDTQSVFGPLQKGKFGPVSRADNFDVFTALTSRQLDDLRSAELVGRNSHVVPNSRSLPTRSESAATRDADFLVVARLHPTKRIEHSISAIARLRQDGVDAGLTIVGVGETEAFLRQHAADLGIADHVHFDGFDPAAAERFTHHRFSILTGKFEGLPLVLVESQAAGCVPIAYDVRYGPADIITDGVNGFLVPPGDVEALAQTMKQAFVMNDSRFATMRAAALESASKFGDVAVTQRWGDVIRDGLQRKQNGTATAVSLRHVHIRAAAGKLILEADIFGTVHDQTTVYVAWHSPEDVLFGRHQGELHLLEPGLAHASFELPTNRFQYLTATAKVYIDAVSDRSFERMQARPAEDWAAATVDGLTLQAGSSGSQIRLSRA